VAVVLVASACQQWPTMRGTPGNTAFNGSETELSLADAGAVSQLFRADLGVIEEGWQSPTISGSQIFAPTATGLGAFDLNGAAGCSGAPTTCQPMWTGDVGTRTIGTAATVFGTTVFVTAGMADDGKLFAFDVRGQVGCSGSPKRCQPLWTAPGTFFSAPTFDGSTAFLVDHDGHIAAFDANGTTGCSGSPKVCSPLWTTSGEESAAPATAAIANGTLYISTFASSIEAYDTAGVEGCSGTPKTCEPLWYGEVVGESAAWPTAPVVSGDRVYLSLEEGWDPPPDPRTIVTGYALDGGDACTGDPGEPRFCEPEWTATFDHSTGSNEMAAAYGKLYVQTQGPAAPWTSQLVALDTEDPTCTPGPCDPAWIAAIGPDAGLVSPIVANGAVYVDRTGSIRMVDAHGVTGCGGTPHTCTSLTFATFPDSYATGSALANGRYAIITFASVAGQDRFTLRVFG
jgi:hypothetical protein